MAPRVDALGIVVNDMATALSFYRLLGLDIPADADSESHAEAVLPGGIRLMWDTVELVRSLADWDPPQGGRPISLAFVCDSPDEVDTLHASLVAAGHRSHATPYDAFWGQRYATVLDPDGNPVDLFAPLP